MAKDAGHRWVVDSLDAGIARVEEDGDRMLSVPADLLPPGVTEGQILRVTRAADAAKGSVVVTIVIDADGTRDALAKSKASMARAMKASGKQDPGGDVSL